MKFKTKDMSFAYKYCVLCSNMIHSFDLFRMMAFGRLCCGVLWFLVFFQSSASELDVQARFERLERRMENFETYLGTVIQIT